MFDPDNKDAKPVDITDIELGRNVYAVDPCYEPEEGVLIKNVLPGKYKAYIVKQKEGEEGWSEGRPKKLIVEHEDYVNADKTYEEYGGFVCVDSGQAGIFDKDYYNKIFEDGKETEKWEKWYNKCFDLSYFEVDNADHLSYFEWLQKFHKVGHFFRIKTNKKLYQEYLDSKYKPFYDAIFGIANLDNKGVNSSTNYGDGFYPVYVNKNDKGKVTGIMIDFYPSCDE